MRNTLKYLIIGVLAILASCDSLNEVPEFSDSDAFVAFDNSAASIDENGATISLPVTLASISGMSQTVTYMIIDGTALEGVNFSLVDASKTLSFDSENRTQNIEINIVDIPGIFTGDLSFQIQLSEDGAVKPSAQNICTVTIKDLDHPLSGILGDYTTTGDPFYSNRGPFDNYTVSFDKDPEDVTVVWISNLDPYFASYGYVAPDYNYFYGIVDEELTEIKIPAGQAMNYDDVTLEGMSIANPASDDDPDADNIIIEIQDGGATLVIKYAYGPFSGGWWNLMNGGQVLNKSTK